MKTIFILLLGILSARISHAHTCSPQKVKCPIDNASVEFCVTMSMTTFGGYYDFQKIGAIGSYYEELINSCPKCHYAGYISDFDTSFSKAKRMEIESFLSQYQKLKMDDAMECMVAAEIKEFLGASNDAISDCYLIGSYLLRSDSTKRELRVVFQSKTKDYLLAALDSKEYTDPPLLASIRYLIAEMYRRIGDFETAIEYYDQAIADANKKDWVLEVATKQKELAIRRDDSNDL